MYVITPIFMLDLTLKFMGIVHRTEFVICFEKF